jgi:hypothetical protein
MAQWRERRGHATLRGAENGAILAATGTVADAQESRFSATR